MVTPLDVIAPLAALVLFLYGIEHLSAELQRVAADKFRVWLTRLTVNRWAGAGLGLATTALIQSSTATTVIVVGLVDAGFLSFHRALGVLVGSNIGTTVTAQLVAFKFTAFAPLFLILGFLLSIFGGKHRWLGKPIFYFGLLFFALEYLSASLDPVKASPAVQSWLLNLHSVWVGLLAGAVVTILFQSSSVTSGLVVVFGMQGLLSLEMAIPLILGANIGTTTTTIIASLRAELFARRTAAAHLLFNIGGVVLFLPFLEQFTETMRVFTDPGMSIAMAHTVFNGVTAILFLCCLTYLEQVSAWLVPGEQEELLFRTRYLDPLPSGVKVGLRAVRKELRHQMDIIRELFALTQKMIMEGDISSIKRVRKLESISDFLDDRISQSLAVLSERTRDKETAQSMYVLTRASNETEQIADFGEDYADIAETLHEQGKRFEADELAELASVYALVEENCKALDKLFRRRDKKVYRKMKSRTQKVSAEISAAYARQVKAMAKEEHRGTTFVDALAVLENANNRLLNCAKLLVGT